MKYALLVLGILLVVTGGYFLFTGSNIVESERGWSSVIAGTTALTGGIITLALAGVVKGLEDLKQLLASAAVQPEAAIAFATEAPAAAMEAAMEMLIAPNLGPAPAGRGTRAAVRSRGSGPGTGKPGHGPRFRPEPFEQGADAFCPEVRPAIYSCGTLPGHRRAAPPRCRRLGPRLAEPKAAAALAHARAAAGR